jgi:hypothetical protein
LPRRPVLARPLLCPHHVVGHSGRPQTSQAVPRPLAHFADRTNQRKSGRNCPVRGRLGRSPCRQFPVFPVRRELPYPLRCRPAQLLRWYRRSPRRAACSLASRTDRDPLPERFRARQVPFFRLFFQKFAEIVAKMRRDQLASPRETAGPATETEPVGCWRRRPQDFARWVVRRVGLGLPGRALTSPTSDQETPSGPAPNCRATSRA